MPRIKIDGITNIEDAKWASILGVEFISVSLEEDSLKKISIDMAKEIRGLLPSYTEFVAELGEAVQVEPKIVKKLSPRYVQLKNSTDPQELRAALEKLSDPVILEMDSDSSKPDLEGMNIPFIQLNISRVPDEKELLELKQAHNMENTIVQGDWDLADIKKACQILQPFAWSIKTVIDKSPRRVDYNKMKQYIREISLL